MSLFFFYSPGAHRDLHSFPTRRSSDLQLRLLAQRNIRDLVEKKRSAVRNIKTTHAVRLGVGESAFQDRKSTRLNSSHTVISYAVFCLKKKKKKKKKKIVKQNRTRAREM